MCQSGLQTSNVILQQSKWYNTWTVTKTPWQTSYRHEIDGSWVILECRDFMVTHLLIVGQKRIWVQILQYCLDCFSKDGKYIWQRLSFNNLSVFAGNRTPVIIEGTASFNVVVHLPHASKHRKIDMFLVKTKKCYGYSEKNDQNILPDCFQRLNRRIRERGQNRTPCIFLR